MFFDNKITKLVMWLLGKLVKSSKNTLDDKAYAAIEEILKKAGLL